MFPLRSLHLSQELRVSLLDNLNTGQRTIHAVQERGELPIGLLDLSFCRQHCQYSSYENAIFPDPTARMVILICFFLQCQC